MSRIARKNLNASFFHVMSQGINREKIFYKESYRKKYLDLIRENEKNYNIEIIAYCVMSNHVHMLIYIEQINELSNFMRMINTSYARYFNWSEERVGYVFRNRFKSEPILDEKYLWQCIKYIHKNPVKAQMVQKCEDYEFSSYNDYKKKTGVAKNKILNKIFGSENYFSNIEHADDFSGFIEDENNKEEVMEEYIKYFLCRNNMVMPEVLEDKKKLKELINVLLNNANMSKRDVEKRFNISSWKVEQILKL